MTPDFDELPRFIYVDRKGGITYQSVVKKWLSEDELERLLTLVEDNIVRTDYDVFEVPIDDDNYEEIDWKNVEAQWHGT